MRLSLSITALLLALGCGASNATTEAACGDSLALDAQEATELYLAAWTEEDPSERACMIERSLAADAVWLGTAGPIEGRSAIAENLADQVASLEGETSSRDIAGTIQFRHHEARLTWVRTDRSGT